MAVPTYIVRITDLDGSTIIDAPHRNLQVSYALDGQGGCDWTMPIRDTGVTRANFDPMKREVKVIRDGTTIWGGYLWNVTASTSEGTVRCAAQGYFSKLYRRYIDVDKIYTGADQYDIAWDLIDYTQGKTNGAMGITRFSGAGSGTTRDAKFRFWERRNIGEVIEQMAALNNGFDFEITPTKQWKTYSPRKGSAISDDFELGVNVHGISIDVDGTDIATEVHAIGAGERDRTCIAIATDASAQSAYRRLEAVIDYQDIKHFSTLQDKAQRFLNMRKGPRVQPQLSVVTNSPPWGNYSVGDTATVIANYGYLTMNSDHRIIAIVIQLTPAGDEVISVHFDEVTAP